MKVKPFKIWILFCQAYIRSLAPNCNPFNHFLTHWSPGLSLACFCFGLFGPLACPVVSLVAYLSLALSFPTHSPKNLIYFLKYPPLPFSLSLALANLSAAHSLTLSPYVPPHRLLCIACDAPFFFLAANNYFFISYYLKVLWLIPNVFYIMEI